MVEPGTAQPLSDKSRDLLAALRARVNRAGRVEISGQALMEITGESQQKAAEWMLVLLHCVGEIIYHGCRADGSYDITIPSECGPA